MLRVGVVGAGGRMGQEVCRAVAGDDGLELVAAVDPASAGRTWRAVRPAASPTWRVAAGVEALAEAGAQVVVDFTVAAAARRQPAVVRRAGDPRRGGHHRAGRGGHGRRWPAASTGPAANAVFAANFAVGAVLLMRFCELAAPYMESVEVIELHHDRSATPPRAPPCTPPS